MIGWWNTTAEDLDEILDLSYEIWPRHSEGTDLLSRFHLAPEGCWTLKDDIDVVGYCLTQPSYYHNPPKLSQAYIPSNDHDCYHLHDIAILPDYQGMGYARVAVGMFLNDLERNMPKTLICVDDTYDFWFEMGFQEHPDKQIQAMVANDYGIGSFYMHYIRGDKNV